MFVFPDGEIMTGEVLAPPQILVLRHNPGERVTQPRLDLLQLGVNGLHCDGVSEPESGQGRGEGGAGLPLGAVLVPQLSPNTKRIIIQLGPGDVRCQGRGHTSQSVRVFPPLLVLLSERC